MKMSPIKKKQLRDSLRILRLKKEQEKRLKFFSWAKNKGKVAFYNTLGFMMLGLAYVGVVTPGIPFSIFLVIATWSFAKGNPIMHEWLYNHKHFGPYLKNWNNYRVFPMYGKIGMVLMMSFSIGLLYYGGSVKGALYLAITCLFVAIWAWRYPSSKAEAEKRIKEGRKIGWLK